MKAATKFALGSAAFASALALAAGPGALGAAATTYVLSDTVKFSAQLVPNSTGGYTLQNITCSLTSDGETGVFACQISGTVTPIAGTSQATVNSAVTSGDGTINSSAIITENATTGAFKGTGRGTEADIEKGRQKPPYPCKAKTSGTISTAGVMTGKIKVTEASNQP
jgi:hypothetical protein